MYRFLDKDGGVLYVGKAINVRRRVSSYFSSIDLGEKTQILVSLIDTIQITTVTSELESLLLEASYIKKFNPKYNARLTDGKAYPLIRVSVKSQYPTVLIARKNDDPKSVYFGPFPHATTVRMVLKLIRRIFPFQSVVNHAKRICLFHHLGLCPCPPMFSSPEQKKEYKKNIRHLIQFLDGKKEVVLKELVSERDKLTKKEQYELASDVQKKIDAIHYITGRSHKPFEYDVNPTLASDLRKEEVDSLTRILQEHGVAAEKLHRIECYDISNTAGVGAVGSLVVFTNGEKDSKWYRRFRIKPNIKGPNDFAMLASVLKRRLTHGQWPTPDLFIVDGGKGQVSSAKMVLMDAAINVPLIGLAKRDEIIITADFVEIRLPKDSAALRLVMRIRDEAHRFAITYHKLVRSRFIFE